jgi:hypothetical protein
MFKGFFNKRRVVAAFVISRKAVVSRLLKITVKTVFVNGKFRNFYSSSFKMGGNTFNFFLA